MFLKKTLCCAALALAAFNANAGAGPLSIQDGKFYKDGKPFYGVGVNYFDAVIRNPATTPTTLEGLQILRANNIPFVRISALPFWPRDLKAVFSPTDQKISLAYHARLKKFLDDAAANNIGVIVDVFWNWTAIADMEDEAIPKTGVAGSKTMERMKKITLEIVDAYQGHKAVWAWEFSNEASSFMDLTEVKGYNNGRYLPTDPALGAPNYSLPIDPADNKPKRLAKDNFTPTTITAAVQLFAETVRTLDKTTPIFSGNNIPRANAYHMRHWPNSYVSDSKEEFGKILEENDPAPVDTFSMHLYPYSEGTKEKYFGLDGATIAQIIGAAMERSKLAGSKRPFFLGEFGADSNTIAAGGLGPDAANEKFFKFSEVILAQQVQMSALWVYDFSYQDKSYNVTNKLRNNQLYELARMNGLMRTW
ncbi:MULTISPECIES: cellulase family glycosylhydrolase [unclassified Janthinobacterium]|uniref:cellulase family glycosylhydrolase n=1 Tax=unclassified Janthinobacterium TaxID=2610881 RepID=UPI0003455880|nr:MULTISPECIES: cellulase family glycosylhydrolase [unclassified Janthinobacterium]MEC5160886.1 hypothetical protein [Janthinobacterium sp. CG_S6]